MDVKWDYELKPGETRQPILHHQMVTLPDGLQYPNSDDLAVIFPGTGQSLKTWGRTEGTKTLDPHWIGVRKPTPLHRDPSYPRYSHHLVLRCDSMWLWGLDKERVDVHRGTFFILDGHSPHQLAAEKLTRGQAAPWYVAISYDTSDAPVAPETVIPVLLDYALTHPLMP